MTAVRVPLVDLRAQYDALRGGIDAALAAVIARSEFIDGHELAEFERWFAGYCGVRHAVGVSSGTTALELVLRALDIRGGDEVIVPANSFIAPAAAVVAVGARPVFVDVEDRTCNLDPDRLEPAITARTKAVIPVHLYGRPAAMREIREIADRRRIGVIEDAAQAHGARYRGTRAGALALAGCFSFYPTKNLGAFGDGGLVTTSDDRLAARLRLLRDHGRTGRYEHAVVGFTARLDNLQAAVLRVQADRLDEWNAQRRQVAAWYRQTLPSAIRTPCEDPDVEPVHHLFAVRVARRDAFRERLEAHGIATAIHYPIPLHLQPAFGHLGYSKGNFPVAERLATETVSLPMHPFLRELQVQYVGEVAADFLRRGPD